MEDYYVIDKAMENGYKVATGENTFEDLLEEEDIFICSYHPMLSKKRKVICLNNMIEYFECEEEYEKCSELLKIKYILIRGYSNYLNV